MSLPPPPPRRARRPDAPGLAPSARRPRRSDAGRLRVRWIVIGGLVAVVVVAGAAAALLGGGGGTSGPKLKASTNVALTAGDTKVESTGAPIQLGNDVRDGVLATLGAYVDQAIVTPLRKGAATADLTKPFDIGAAGKLSGPDRAVLLDEHLPKAAGKVTVTTPPVALTGLAGDDGKVVLVTATVNLKITARALHGVVTITRVGTIVFAPDPSGTWKIDGWTLHVERSGPGVQAAPTTAAAPTTTTTRKAT